MDVADGADIDNSAAAADSWAKIKCAVVVDRLEIVVG